MDGTHVTVLAALRSCRDGRKSSARRLLLLDAVTRGNDELAVLLARRCGCDVIRLRDVTSSCVGKVAGVVMVHSPTARRLYDDVVVGRRGSSSVDRLFTRVVSDLTSQRRHTSAIRIYHVSYLADCTRSHDIIQ